VKFGGICGAGLAMVAALLAAGCEQQQQDPGAESDPAPPTSTSASPSSAMSPAPPTPTTSFEPAPRQFDHAAMQDAVHQILTEYHQVENLGTVICPPRKPVEEGVKFSCTATIDGEQKKVPITVTSDDGDYRVGAPR